MHFAPPFPSLTQLKKEYIRSETVYRRGKQLVDMDMCTLIFQQGDLYRFSVEDRFEDFIVDISLADNCLSHTSNAKSMLECSHHVAAALIRLYEKFESEKFEDASQGEAYTREEMIHRVLKERRERAEKESYNISYADSVHGIHQLYSASGKVYHLTIRDFDKDLGYCTCPDFKTNKLGTCKHLMFALWEIRKKFNVKKLTAIQPYPFVEIYCDPLNEYHITYFYRENLSIDTANLLETHFQGKQYLRPEEYPSFLTFLKSAEEIKQILIRPEVIEKIDRYFEQQTFKKLAETTRIDFGKLKADLFEYQKEGILFSLFKSGNIIADEMGLGKTLQAIGVAVFKKELYGLKRILIVCPASLKFQWKKEIERFSSQKAAVVEGSRAERQQLYRKCEDYFLITNYEAVMRDISVIIRYAPDMVILDEAQRIKNYATKTSYAVKAIPKKHALVITGTPIENRLGDLYSIMNFIDPEVLAPLWEFSMQHCYFDKSKKEKITGYFNLQQLKERLNPWIIRREKKDVLEQLPEVQELTVPVRLDPRQEEIHVGLAQTLGMILRKRHKTLYDMQRIQRLLQNMRMVCNSTFLIDKETNISPKLTELEEILLEKLNIQHNHKKVIIFSEWKGMLRLIEKMLQANKIGSVMFSGEVEVKNRSKLLEAFENNPDCKVFLSTEAGGAGLNLQVADTIINFELPWNPVKKDQRIGWIHRIGQKSTRITAIHLVSFPGIEQRILDGIVLKTSLFEAVLNEGNLTDEVDFSEKGHATFIQQIQQLISAFEAIPEPLETEVEAPDFTGKSSEYPSGALEQADLFDTVERQKGMLASTESRAERADDSPDQDTTQKAAAAVLPADELEKTLNQGLQFLNGLLKMASGKELITEAQSIKVDRKTGEVTMKFKLPGF